MGVAVLYGRAGSAQDGVPDVLAAIRISDAGTVRVPRVDHAGPVQLYCARPNNTTIQLDVITSPRATTGNSRLFNFTASSIRPGQYLTATRSYARCRVRPSDADDVLAEFSLAIDPPAVGTLFAYHIIDSTAVIGGTIAPVVRVLYYGPSDSVGIPVRGADVTLSGVPGMPGVAPAQRTDGTGEARFADIMLQGKTVGRHQLVFRASAGDLSAATTDASLRVHPGLPDTIRIDTISLRQVRAGEPVHVSAVVVDRGGNDACVGALPYLRVSAAPGRFLLTSSDSAPIFRCEAGRAVLSTYYYGPSGNATLTVAAGGTIGSVTFTIRPGSPAALVMMQHPRRFARADSLAPLKPKPQVRLIDDFGNPIPGTRIAARIIGACAVRQRDCDPPQLDGMTVASTDSTGTASFDSLTFIGREGEYSLCFDALVGGTSRTYAAAWRGDTASAPATCVTAEGAIRVASESFIYNVDREFNRSFVILSAIRSIAGTQVPTNESFDIRFRFRLGASFSTLLSADLALQRTSSSDTTVRSSQRDVTDAMFAINFDRIRIWKINLRVTEQRTDALERLVFIGGQWRVLSGVPYAGFHVGSIEMGASQFFGSTFTVGFARALSYIPVKTGDNAAVYPSRNNVVIDAFLRASNFDFLKFLNLRGTLLLPTEKGRRVQSRLTIAVPIDGIKPF